MKHEDMLKRLAPCGLNRGKCMAYAEGEIRFHGEKLRELLGSFDGYAERFKKFWPVFEHCPQFKALPGHFTGAECRGCPAGAQATAGGRSASHSSRRLQSIPRYTASRSALS
ncbi:MAG TPA: hypothetical protein VLM75_08605 [Spirochaetota bacterium]|nr:hypothetical protein [Spirochaetota bacterium]